jgi:ubiquinone/menaquinone biosynthesis C-methylase UbiE
MSEAGPGDLGALVRRETAWHEENNYKRAGLSALLYDPPAFDRVVADGLAFLRLQPGETVLDMGCGEGKETRGLLACGMRVVGADLFRGQLAETRDQTCRAYPQAPVYFVQADAHSLPFAGGAFRVIYGKAILHHLSIPHAAQEVERLLAAGGRATFAEPLSGHPLFRLGRRLTPQLRTADEHPLSWTEIELFGQAFAEKHYRAYMLLAPAAYVLRLVPRGEGLFRRVHAALQRADGWLLARAPWLRRWAWYGAVEVVKRG